MGTATWEVIKQGQISLKSDLNQHSYVLRVLDKHDLQAVLQLQSNLIAVMEKKEMYVPISEEDLKRGTCLRPYRPLIIQVLKPLLRWAYELQS